VSAHEGSRRAIAAALVANLGIAVAKLVGFAVTGASSLLAEGFHSLADTGNQGLLFLGLRRSARPADELHQFGYGRSRYLWSFVVAMVLFSLGGLFAIYEGVQKLLHPHEIENPAVAFGILGVAVVLELFSLRTAIRESRPVKGSMSWWRFIRRTRQPELPVVLLEDLGALLGLLFALTGVSLSVALDEPLFDAGATVAIGMLLVVIAIVLASEMQSLLIGEAASEEHERAILGAIEASPEVAALIHMRSQHIGPEELLVGVKVELVPDLDAHAVAAAIDAIEARVRETVPLRCVIYVEPDLRRATEQAGGGARP
jgi:cation diffusion facilitator family transporter